VSVGEARVDGRIQDLALVLHLKVRPHVTGRVFPVSFQALPDLLVIVRAGNVSDTGVVGAGGTIDFRPPRVGVSGWGSVAVVPADPAAAPFHPSWVPSPATDLVHPRDIVLVPSAWTVRRGRHAGKTVPVSMNDAFTTVLLARPSYFRGNYRAPSTIHAEGVYDPETDFTAKIMSWRPVDLPMRLGFSHGEGSHILTPEDSVRIWGWVDELEEIFGRDLFEPAVAPTAAWTDSIRPGDLVVTVDTTAYRVPNGIAWTYCGPPRWELRPYPAAPRNTEGWSDGTLDRMWVSACDVASAKIRWTTYGINDEHTVHHELLHTLGPGHGCSWKSIMSYCGEFGSDTVTVQDVAYVEVLEAVSEAGRQYDTAIGLLNALFGERKLLLGLEPVPDYHVLPEDLP
jgi:hypothetical protein